VEANANFDSYGGPYRTENPLPGLNWLFLSCTTVSARLSLVLRNEGRAKEETKALGSYFYMRRRLCELCTVHKNKISI
jgi:hypothetical protein